MPVKYFTGGSQLPLAAGQIHAAGKLIEAEDRSAQVIAAEHILIIQFPALLVLGEFIEHGADEGRKRAVGKSMRL